jgi:tetratricopeptide (TPR) repeat protein
MPPLLTRLHAACFERNWLGPAQLRLFRTVFFALVGLDAWLQIEHAPRYGTGDFHVPHLSWLPLPGAGRPVMLALYLAQAYLALRAALGLASRRTTVLLTALFGYTYFSSQLDSYQHHYLLFLVLLLTCFVTWPPAPQSPGVQWPLRLVLVQLSLVYLWAAVAKLDPRWLDGTALAAQISTGPARALIERLPLAPWSLAAALVVLLELFLALAIHVRRLALPAMAVGLAFHFGIELAGFEIGLFSYFMAAFYLLLLPEPAARQLACAGDRALAWLSRPGTGRGARALAYPAAALGSAALLLFLPFAEAGWLALLVTGLGLEGVWAARRAARREGPGAAPVSHPLDPGRRAAWAHLLLCSVLVALVAATGTARSYYLHRGGAARRTGQLEEALDAYRHAAALDPGAGSIQYRIGDLERRLGRGEAALQAFLRAQALSPDDHRAFVGAALVHHAAGRGAAALAAAEAALRRRGDDRTALRLRAHWLARAH